MKEIANYVRDDDDIAFEYGLQTTPQNITAWVIYLDKWKEQYKNGIRSKEAVLWLYRRYCQEFKDNVDVWTDYIEWNIENNINKSYKDTANLYKESLTHCKNKCEKLCIAFLKFTIQQNDLELIREAFDVGLSLIPKQSHFKFWDVILKFIRNILGPLLKEEKVVEQTQIEGIGSVLDILFQNDEHKSKRENWSKNIWISQFMERYLLVCPDNEIVDILLILGETNDFSRIKNLYAKYLFKNKKYHDIKPSEDMPFSLNITYLNALEQLDDEPEYNTFIQVLKDVFTYNQTSLNLIMAKHLIKRRNFDSAESLLHKALLKTYDIEDFSKIFQLRIDFEQAIIDSCLTALENGNTSVNNLNISDLLSVHLKKLQELVNSYRINLSDLYVRRNPNKISTWLERTELYSTKREKCNVFADAILKIDPLQVKERGTLGELWCRYAQIYWDRKDFDSARELYERSLKVPFPHLNDLEIIWSRWIENELEQFGTQRACLLLESALKVPENPMAILDQYENSKTNIPAEAIVFHSLKLWSLYLDLVESSLGTNSDDVDHIYKKTVDIYENMIKLKLITPILFVSFANFAMQNNDQLKSFQIYERAISSFPPEVDFEIWNIYLNRVIDSSLPTEHVRDLFDEALSTLIIHEIDCKSIYLLYNTYEERHSGVTQSTISKLIDGAKNINNKFVDSKLHLWDLAIEKTKNQFGLLATRSLYEECIQTIPCDKVTSYIVSFAKLETTLGEITRAREILEYGSRLLPPGRNEPLWKYWEEFELTHGDKEKYKDILRLRKKLDEEMKVDTEQVSQVSGNVAFVASKYAHAGKKHDESTINPEEIDLHL